MKKEIFKGTVCALRLINEKGPTLGFHACQKGRPACAINPRDHVDHGSLPLNEGTTKTGEHDHALAIFSNCNQHVFITRVKWTDINREHLIIFPLLFSPCPDAFAAKFEGVSWKFCMGIGAKKKKQRSYEPMHILFSGPLPLIPSLYATNKAKFQTYQNFHPRQQYLDISNDPKNFTDFPREIKIPTVKFSSNASRCDIWSG